MIQYMYNYFRSKLAKSINCDESVLKFWWDRHNRYDNYILYNTENLNVPHKLTEENGLYLKFIQNADIVYDYSTVNLKYIHNSIFFPFLPDIDRDLNTTEKNIDVLFYGGMSDRRKYYIDKISKDYKVLYIEQFLSMNEHIDYVKRSNYVLSIGWNDNLYADFMRITPALNFGANILCENYQEYWGMWFLKKYFSKRIKIIEL